MKDRKGTENHVADHLSRLEDEATRKLEERAEINDAFLDDHVLATTQDLIPWFADIANYLSSDLVLWDLTLYQRKKFLHDVMKFFWDDPYLYRSCADGVNHQYVPEV